MKALLFHQHGTLDDVAYTDIPEPEIGPHDVLVQIKAAALNRLDLWVLQGWPGLKLKMPHIMGSDGAGVIAAVGSQVTHFTIGDRVVINPSLSCGHCHFCRTGRDNLCQQFAILGEHEDGFFAEYAAVPARNLLKMSGEATFTAAAAASLVFVTAWHSLIIRGGLQAGESVLIVGAGGGVNTASIQIARFAGASPIYVVGSDDNRLARAQEAGADVLINRHKEDWGQAVFKATNRRGVDIVVDNVGAATYFTSLRSLKKGGRLLTVGNSSGAKFEFDNRYLFSKQISIIGSSMGTTADYERVMGLLFSGHLHPIIDSIIPLSDGRSALHRLQNNEVIGKLILKP